MDNKGTFFAFVKDGGGRAGWTVGNVNCKVGQCMKFDPKVRYVFHFVVRLKALVDFSSICKKNVDIFKSFTWLFTCFCCCARSIKNVQGGILICDVLLIMAPIFDWFTPTNLGVEMADADAHRKKKWQSCVDFVALQRRKRLKGLKINSRMILNDILVSILKSAVEGLTL